MMAVKQVFAVDTKVELTRPDEQHGDYATSVALQLAAQVHKKPRDVAEALSEKLRAGLKDTVSEISVAGPGFINLKLNDAALRQAADVKPARSFSGKEILVEFGDANPFKAMHLGHLYTAVVGDAISRLFEASGAKVERLSYHGDVGLHVAKAVWQVRRLQGEHSNFLFDAAYAGGSYEYDHNETAKKEIEDVNEHIYKQDDPQINKLYELGKKWSFENFDKIFEELGIHYQKRYLESESTRAGLATVEANLGKVFEKSDGAIIFRGEKAGLHTRVFINSRGLPTYEAKDLGLAELKNKDFPKAAKSVIITAHEQSEYFKVMLAALREIDAKLADKTQHIAHGFLSLTTGKMSSRTGEVYAATDLLSSVQQAVRQQYPEAAKQVSKDAYLAAVKYAFLKNRVGGDIVFDVQESVSLEGNSGPYLQYAHARARSILVKAGEAAAPSDEKLEAGERSLLRKIGEYPEVVDLAAAELLPHHVCTYLYELAQTFNRFYEHNRVIGDARESTRLTLVKQYAETLKAGLNLLGISAPDKM